jgi:hypothetical protein
MLKEWVRRVSFERSSNWVFVIYEWSLAVAADQTIGSCMAHL